MSSYFTKALQALKPNSEWAVTGDQYSRLVWLDESQTKPTEDEVNAKVTELKNAEPMKLLREERDRRLKETDWRASSDLIILEEWKSYRQSLRDLPALSTPTLDSNDNLDMTSVEWPTLPS